MQALLADKFQLEQAVRWLAVKGRFLPGEARLGGGGERPATDALLPASLRPHLRTALPPKEPSHAATPPGAGAAAAAEQRSEAAAHAPGGDAALEAGAPSEQDVEAQIMQRVAAVCSWQAHPDQAGGAASSAALPAPK